MERITHQRRKQKRQHGNLLSCERGAASWLPDTLKSFQSFRCIRSNKSGSLNCDLWPLVVKIKLLQSHTCWKFQNIQSAASTSCPNYVWLRKSDPCEPGHHFKAEDCVNAPEWMWILQFLQISWYLDPMLWHLNFSSFISHLWDVWDEADLQRAHNWQRSRRSTITAALHQSENFLAV